MDIQPAQHDCFAIYIRIGGYTAGWTDEFGGFKQLMYIRKSTCMVEFYDRMKHGIMTIRKNPKMTPDNRGQEKGERANWRITVPPPDQ